MQQGARLALGEERVECSAIADIGSYEHMPGICLLRPERTQIAGVGQLVYIQHRFVRRIRKQRLMLCHTLR